MGWTKAKPKAEGLAMLKQKDLIKERLSKVMLSDKVDGLETLLTVLKSDLRLLLRDFMTLDDDALKLELNVLDDGKYSFNITANTNRLIEVGRMINE